MTADPDLPLARHTAQVMNRLFDMARAEPEIAAAAARYAYQLTRHLDTAASLDLWGADKDGVAHHCREAAKLLEHLAAAMGYRLVTLAEPEADEPEPLDAETVAQRRASYERDLIAAGRGHLVGGVMPLTAQEAVELLRAGAEDRRNAIRECVTWLAMNCHDWKPEALAGELARALLKDD